MKILLIEDREEYRTALKIFLCDKGHNVLEAENGLEAIKIAKEHKDVILAITDFKMPGMNGIELTKRLKEDFPGMKVILNSSYGSMIERAALEAGADTFIDKSDVAKRIEEEIKKLFDD